MEVGQESVQPAKLVTGSKVKCGLGSERLVPASRRRAGFKDASRGCPDGDDSPARLASGVQGGCRLRRKLGGFGVQGVVLDPIDLDRSEGADPNVQGQIHPRDTPLVEAAKDRGREVQPRRRRGDRSGDLSIDRLIAQSIAARLDSLPDIRRKRDRTVAVEKIDRALPFPLGSDHPAPVADSILENQTQTLAHDHRFTQLGPPARLGEDLPATVGQGSEVKPFPPAPGRHPFADQPRRDNPRVVPDQNVARVEEIGQVGEGSMFPGSKVAADHQQARGVARFASLLRDQVGRQIKIKGRRVQGERPSEILDLPPQCTRRDCIVDPPYWLARSPGKETPLATDAATSLAPPADADVFYPESDGKPMAETPIHQDAMIELIHGLRDQFADDPEVYVSGNMFLYFVEGNPRRNVSPDVMVVRGVDKNRHRPTYKTWEEGGKAPDLVVEVTSKSTRREDLRTKLELYRDELKVREYFLFDPLGEYLKPRFRGFRLVGDDYEPIPIEDEQMASEVLGLDLRAVGETVRLVDPATGRIIPNRVERNRALDDSMRTSESLLRESMETNQGLARSNQDLLRMNQELARLNQQLVERQERDIDRLSREVEALKANRKAD